MLVITHFALIEILKYCSITNIILKSSSDHYAYKYSVRGNDSVWLTNDGVLVFLLFVKSKYHR